MTKNQRLGCCVLALVVALSGWSATTAHAKDPEFDAITKHLKSQYRAKRRKIPFMGLANFAVKLIRPAGVKSLKVAIFEELAPVPAAADNELHQVMRHALSPDWLPLVRLRSRDGSQMHVYAREAGENVNLMVVQIDGEAAVVARIKINPQKFKQFLEDPKVLGISLNQ